MDIVAYSAGSVAALSFITGLLITAITGSARHIKVLLGGLSGLFVLVTGVGLVITKGLLIYLVFQLLTLLMAMVILVVLGAVCGGGIYLLRTRRSNDRGVNPAELGDYLMVAEFATREGISEERALSRISSGYYRGGRHGGRWYIHKSELATVP